jgi:hypothetical protein
MSGICQIYVTGRHMTGKYIYLSYTYILTFLQVPDVQAVTAIKRLRRKRVAVHSQHTIVLGLTKHQTVVQ